ncbi:MAG: GNAT family N-acetyltransferase [Xanthobacteraceae bacterium]|jgi:RimJ/RimL family protein N-acetyltransferase
MTLSDDVLKETRRERSIPVLETERLTLRAPRHEDVKAIAVLANDRRIAENTARIPHPYCVADAEQFVATVNRRDDEACFVLMLNGTLVGACGIDPRDDGAELGYWLGAGYWGRGLMTEAARAVIDYGFGDLRHETLQAGARVSNPASRRVLEKCAFQWTGVRLTRIRAIHSAAPVDRFRLDRGLWLSLKAWGRVRRVA